MPRPARPFLADVPQSRTAAPELLAQLREVDARAELVYAGDGRWWLGEVIPSAARRAQGATMLRRQAESPKPLREKVLLGALALRGFSYVAEYVIAGEPDGRIVLDYRARTWRYLHAADAEFEARLAVSSGDDRRAASAALRRDYHETECLDQYRYVTRKPVSVLAAPLPA